MTKYIAFEHFIAIDAISHNARLPTDYLPFANKIHPVMPTPRARTSRADSLGKACP